ncbi:CBS domain-containing protein [Micromonospora arborensis]|uniref:CBS domain-containing protein n=1 Tax=Micromonospora arborensis TaxID=2116518 RepID=UPI003F4D3EAC
MMATDTHRRFINGYEGESAVEPGEGGPMTTARDIMTPGTTCIGEGEDVLTAARRMAELDIGSMPICGSDNRLKGMLTDRDIVVKVLAEGRDPSRVTAGELAQGKPVTIGADDDAEEILHTMGSHQVRRLPVIDGHELVGMVAVADVARALSDRPVGDLIDAISQN